jgi:hypothetical protein
VCVSVVSRGGEELSKQRYIYWKGRNGTRKKRVMYQRYGGKRESCPWRVGWWNRWSLVPKKYYGLFLMVIIRNPPGPKEDIQMRPFDCHRKRRRKKGRGQADFETCACWDPFSPSVFPSLSLSLVWFSGFHHQALLPVLQGSLVKETKLCTYSYKQSERA